MGRKSNEVTITIDDKTCKTSKGSSILLAAEENDIYIPSLCAHKDLTTHGGCRICLVEVEGKRGFLKSCATPVEEGMIVRTSTDRIQMERREILRLLLSEHTSSCLICDEREECQEFMGTIRKGGVTTGCRYCPNDRRCELQKVVEWVGVEEINYPVYYRGLPVEREDPFYDRDYNLCILCGRCVRVCQEVRSANILAFNQRGRDTIIGPAFGRSHVEAGCEFCGACVSICPTGSLMERANKWDGEPDREVTTTCALCGVGCQMRVLIKGDKVIGTLPAEDRVINNDQLCVKGRFCVNELVNDRQRLNRPFRSQDGIPVQITLEDAISTAAERLSRCRPADFAMFVSPNCTNEDMYIAQKFVRTVMGSHHIDSTARRFYGFGFNNYLNLMKMNAAVDDIENASVVLCIGLDLRYGRSVVGVRLRNAVSKGAKIISINPRDHSLSLLADIWLRPAIGQEGDLLSALVELTGSGKKGQGRSEQLVAVAQMLEEASAPIILVGPDFLQYDDVRQLLESVGQLARNVDAGVMALPSQSNLYGSLLMGTYPELLPGGFPALERSRVDALRKAWGQKIPYYRPPKNVKGSPGDRKLRVAYLIGEVPLHDQIQAEFLIYQNIYPLDDGPQPDLILPAAAFTEVDGTFINGEGRIQRLRKAVHSPGDALPDWEILCRIARKMGASGFDFTAISKIHKEIASLVDGFGSFHRPRRAAASLPGFVHLSPLTAKPPASHRGTKKWPFLLTISFAQHTYRGIPLSKKVAGLKQIVAEEQLIMNPEDAEKLNIVQSDQLTVMSNGFQETWPVFLSKDQPEGTLHVTYLKQRGIDPNPRRVKVRRKNG